MRRLALLSLLIAAGCHKQAAEAPQPAPVAAAAAPAETGAVDTANAGKPLPDVAIKDMAGAEAKLSALKGRPVLVNMWATWCVPCIRELPTLDALAKAQAGKLTVLAVSEDAEGARVVQPFLAKRGFGALKPMLDTANALMLQLKEVSLPATILYGADGKEIARVRGGMDWTGPKAKALLAQAGI